MTKKTKVKFINIVSGELRKAFMGSAWYVMLLIGIGMAALTVVGSASEASEQIEAGATVASTTSTTIRFWFMVLLGSGLFGVVFVTREFTSGSIVRSALLTGTRTRLFWAKLVVSTMMGLLYAAITVGLVFASLPVIGMLSGTAPEWSTEATRTVIGVAAVIAAAAPWGTVIGWLIRSNVGAVGAFLALTLIVDEGLFRLSPEVGRYTMQIAMGAVYQDGKADALSPEWGVVVMVAWVAAGATAAKLFLRHRDLP